MCKRVFPSSRSLHRVEAGAALLGVLRVDGWMDGKSEVGGFFQSVDQSVHTASLVRIWQLVLYHHASKGIGSGGGLYVRSKSGSCEWKI